MNGGLLRWRCLGRRPCPGADDCPDDDCDGETCHGMREHRPGDALRFYRRGPTCPVDDRHGSLVLHEEIGAHRHVPVGGRP